MSNLAIPAIAWQLSLLFADFLRVIKTPAHSGRLI